MPFRPIADTTKNDCEKLASIFETLQGGSDSSRRAATYLRQLVNNTLPQNDLIPLVWHCQPAEMEVMPVAHERPHECVIAVLCPSVPLRIVWKRGRV